MTTFTAQSIPLSDAPLDLTKHVYYQQGMILGSRISDKSTRTYQGVACGRTATSRAMALCAD